jgi:hypothetical protein
VGKVQANLDQFSFAQTENYPRHLNSLGAAKLCASRSRQLVGYPDRK